MSAPLTASSRKLSLTPSPIYAHFKGNSAKKEACFKDAFKRYNKKTFVECLKLVSNNPDNEPLFLRDDSLFSAFGPKVSKSAQLFLAAIYIKETQRLFNFEEFKSQVEFLKFAQIVPELKEIYFKNIHAFINKYQELFGSATSKFVQNFPIAKGLYTGRIQIRGGKRMGHSTMHFNSGGEYVGQFKNGEFNGCGSFVFVNRNKYVGEFKDGKENGHGTFTYSNGDKAVGQFIEGKLNGHGTWTYFNIGKFVGQFMDGRFYGHGTFIFDDGDKLVGQFIGGKLNGYGIFTCSNGDKFVGQFINGKFHGYGTKYDIHGAVLQSGLWENSRFLQAAPIPESVTAAVASIEREMPAVIAACEEASVKAKETYLKVQNMLYTPHYFPLIQAENKKDQWIKKPLPNVITGIIGEYAAPDWEGDDKEWNIEKSALEKVKASVRGFFQLA